jgi:hypothetical protein
VDWMWTGLMFGRDNWWTVASMVMNLHIF